MTVSRPSWIEQLAAGAGGRPGLRTIALLSAALALAAGDQTIVGAVAPSLKADLGLDNTQIGLLITGASLVGAATTLPFGVLADRVARVRMLAWCVVSWSVSVACAGVTSTFTTLLLAQLALGAGIGAATPVVASLIGDLFPAGDRGRVFGLVLTGEFLGAAFALVLAGQMAAWWSWRGAFWILAVPGPLLAIALVRAVAEPVRGAMEQAAAAGDTAEKAVEGATARLPDLVRASRVRPHTGQVLTADPTDRPMWWAVRYVLSIRTNVLLIVASALVYYYVAGLQAFVVVFLRGRFDLGQGTATMLLILVGLAVVVGTLIAGPLSDRLMARGRIAARPLVGGIACLVAVAFAIPGLAITAFLVAFPILLLASVGIGGANPPLDAGRLDVMHFRLWGRAESVRAFIQNLLKSSAPLVFGYLSVVLSPAGSDPNQEQGGGAEGLTRTLLVMLVLLAVAGVILLAGARRTYPRDVATALASEASTGRG